MDNIGNYSGERTSGKSCAQHRAPKEIDGRRRLMAWLGEIGWEFLGHHCKIGQRTRCDRLVRVIERIF